MPNRPASPDAGARAKRIRDLVMRVDERMARPHGFSRRTAGFVGLFGVVAMLSAALPATAQDGPKKVGTERIVVPSAPSGSPAGDPHAGPVPSAPAAGASAGAPQGPPPEVRKGTEGLPPLVVKMRQRLLDAAYSGDMQRLKVAMQVSEMPPVFSVNEIGDPIEFLKKQSGDGQGLEILAILTDVLEASWVRINPGTRQEMYVWPSFTALPLDRLDASQTVEIYKIVTSSDFEEMKSVGRYTFYNVGIGPDGTWHWFKPAD